MLSSSCYSSAVLICLGMYLFLSAASILPAVPVAAAEEVACVEIDEFLCTTERGDFSTMCDIYNRYYVEEDFGETLDYAPITLFVPTNEAWDDLNTLFGRDMSSEGSQLLERLFFFHVMSDPVLYDDLLCKELYTMLSGDTSRTLCLKNPDNPRPGVWEKYQKGGGNRKNNNEPKIYVDSYHTDIITCDGSVLHIIESVMLPNFINEMR